MPLRCIIDAAPQLTDSTHDVVCFRFDDVVQTMQSTGKDMPLGYKETSLAGLARIAKLEAQN